MLSREWRCSWSSADRRCSNYIWVIDNFIAYLGASYIRGFTVVIFSQINDSYLYYFRWQDRTVDYSTLVQVIGWCLQATSNYLNQSWPISMSHYVVTGLGGLTLHLPWTFRIWVIREISRALYEYRVIQHAIKEIWFYGMNSLLLSHSMKPTYR